MAGNKTASMMDELNNEETLKQGKAVPKTQKPKLCSETNSPDAVQTSFTMMPTSSPP